MGDWERRSPGNIQRQRPPSPRQQQGGGFYHHGRRGGCGGGRANPTRSSFSSNYGRPPISGCCWQTNSEGGQVPTWQKRFCYEVGSIPWKKLCEAKTMLSFYKSVAEWDDSACEEAFRNAKARYWAYINNLPCDIPLADPDVYIDDIDWDAKIDSKLVSDLESKSSDDHAKQNAKFSYLTSEWVMNSARKGEAVDPPATSGWGEGGGDNWKSNYMSWGDDSWGRWEEIKENCSSKKRDKDWHNYHHPINTNTSSRYCRGRKTSHMNGSRGGGGGGGNNGGGWSTWRRREGQ